MRIAKEALLYESTEKLTGKIPYEGKVKDEGKLKDEEKFKELRELINAMKVKNYTAKTIVVMLIRYGWTEQQAIGTLTQMEKQQALQECYNLRPRYHQQIGDFIMTMSQNGAAASQIVEALSDAGWDKGLAQEFVDAYGGNDAPRNPNLQVKEKLDQK